MKSAIWNTVPSLHVKVRHYHSEMMRVQELMRLLELVDYSLVHAVCFLPLVLDDHYLYSSSLRFVELE